MNTRSVPGAKTIALISLALPLLANCKGKKEFPKLEEVYKSKSCDAGQHFDGKTLSCVADVAPIAVTGFTSFADVDFNARAASIQDFITQYVAANAADYTLSAAPTCTEVVETNDAYGSGSYVGNDTFECAFTLSKDGAAVLTFERQDPHTAVTPADGADAPKFANPVLKVVQNTDSDKAKVLICTYEASPGISLTSETDGKYDPDAEGSKELYPKITECHDFGTSKLTPPELDGQPAALQAMPASLNAFLKGERTKFEISGEKIYNYAANHATSITGFTVTCDTTTFTINATLTPDALNPVTGKVAFAETGDAATFFDASDIQGVDGFTYTKARSFLGCTSLACLEDAVTYKFYGSLLVVDGPARSVFTTGGGTTAAFAEAGPANVAPACAYTYKLQEK